MNGSMLAAVASRPNDYAIREVSVPRPGPAEALVRVVVAAICGSDLKLLSGNMDGVEFPLIPGHEWAGVVESAPSGYEDLIGRAVVSDLLQSCGQCAFCCADLPNLCETLTEPGLSLDGAFAEYVCVRASNLLPLPESVTLTDACLIEPLAVALYAMKRVEVRRGDTVVVLGGGCIGQLLLILSRSAGADVTVIDPHDERLRTARRLGATCVLDSSKHDPRDLDPSAKGLADVVFDAAGSGNALAMGLELVRPGGRVGAIGYAGRETVTFQSAIIMRKLIDVRGVLSPTGTWREAVRLAAEGILPARELLTHRMPLARFDDAVSLARSRCDGVIRAVLTL